MKSYIPETDGATTEDWTKATEGMTITAYDLATLTSNRPTESESSVLTNVNVAFPSS